MTTTDTTQEFATPIIFNQYPAKVINPDGGTIADKVRAIVTPDLFVIYREGTTPSGLRQIQTQLTFPITSSRPHAERGNAWIVVDEQGGEWEILRGAGCGCGSALRAMPSPVPVHMG